MTQVGNAAGFAKIADWRSSTKKSNKTPGSSGSWDVPQDSRAEVVVPTPNLLIPKTASAGAQTRGLATVENKKFSTPIQRFEEAEESKHQPEKTWVDTAKKVGVAAALGAISLVGVAQAAQAQVVTTAVQQQQARSTAPVRVESPLDAVEQFNAENQLYVVGEPMLNGNPVNLDSLQDALQEHPNVYVVINGEYVENLEETEIDVGYGIGNSEEFLSVRHRETGERNGVVFYINLDVNRDQQPTGRATLMRSEGLADELGVGDGEGGDGFDAWFPNGEPGKLGGIFVNSIGQKNLGNAMRDVFEEINTTIDQSAVPRLRSAESQVRSSQSLLEQAETAVAEFQQLHGRGGELGGPNIEGWRYQSRQIHEAFQARDFQRLERLTQGFNAEMAAYEEAAAGFLQAKQGATPLAQSLEQLSSELGELPDNPEAAVAREVFQRAQQAMRSLETSVETKALGTSDNYREARMLERRARTSVENSFQARTRSLQIKFGSAAAVSVGLLAAGYLTNRKAKERAREATSELDKATDTLRQHSSELLSSLDTVDYTKIASFTGETKALSDELVKSAVTALTLAGGVEEFLAQAKADIEGKNLFHKVKNLFATGNFEHALKLLNQDESGESLSFNTSDAVQAPIDETSNTAVWRKEILDAGMSEELSANLHDLLKKMGEQRPKTDGQASSLSKKASISELFAKDAVMVKKDAPELLEAGRDDGLFTAKAVTEGIVPELPAVKDGSMTSGEQSVPLTDPVRLHREFVEPNHRLLRNSREVIEIAKFGRGTLLPNLEVADAALSEQGVKTDWAHGEKNELSKRLDEVAETVKKAETTDLAFDLKQDVHGLNAKLNTAVQQDELRREVLPQDIDTAQSELEVARRVLFDELQATGAFRKGTAEQMLTEADRNPSDILDFARSELNQVKPKLDTGDIAAAGDYIQRVRNKTEEANAVVADSRQALRDYPSKLQQRQVDYKSLSERLNSETVPALKRIESSYVAKVMEQAAKELGGQDSLANTQDDVSRELQKSEKLTVDAVTSFDKAELLGSKDQLEGARLAQDEAAHEMDLVIRAEEDLSEKQQMAEKQVPAEEKSLAQVKESAAKPFARKRAQALVKEASSKLAEAKSLVNAEIKSPYDAVSGLAATVSLLNQAEKALKADEAAYGGALGSISKAEAALTSAEKSIRDAEKWNSGFHVSGYGSVWGEKPDLDPPRKQLNEAQETLGKAKSALDATDFEEASDLAATAVTLATRVSSEVARLVKKAQAELDKKIAEARKKARPSTPSYGGSSGSSYQSGRRRSNSSGSSHQSGRRRSSSSGSSWSSGSSRSGSSSSSSSSRSGGRATGRRRPSTGSSGSRSSSNYGGSSGSRRSSKYGGSSSGHRRSSNYGGSSGHRRSSSSGARSGRRSSGGSSGGW